MKTYNIRFGDTIMRRMHKTRIRFFSWLSDCWPLSLLNRTSMAQTTPPQGVGGTVNSPGYVLHGRTKRVVNEILDALGPGITRYKPSHQPRLTSTASLPCPFWRSLRKLVHLAQVTLTVSSTCKVCA